MIKFRVSFDKSSFHEVEEENLIEYIVEKIKLLSGSGVPDVEVCISISDGLHHSSVKKKIFSMSNSPFRVAVRLVNEALTVVECFSVLTNLK